MNSANINHDLRGAFYRMGSSNTWIIFLVAFLGQAIEQSSSLPRNRLVGSGTSSSKELEENLSAEKVLLPEVERNKTKDEGPDYLFEKEIFQREPLDYNLAENGTSEDKVSQTF